MRDRLDDVLDGRSFPRQVPTDSASDSTHQSASPFRRRARSSESVFTRRAKGRIVIGWEGVIRIRNLEVRTRPGRALTGAAIAVLCVTLLPAPVTNEDVPILCLLCGSEGGADLVLNIGLFVPIGYLAFRALSGRMFAFAFVLLLPLAVESLQMLIPGRHPTTGDLLANWLGGLLGIVGALLVDRRRRADAKQIIAALALPALLCVSLPMTVLLLEPEIPSGVHYGQWTPKLEFADLYPGMVHAAGVADRPLPDGLLDDVAVAGLRAGLWIDPLIVEFTAGSAPARLAPIFRIVDGHGIESVLVGARRNDLVVRVRRRSRSWRFRSPELRFAGLHPDPGERLSVTLQRRSGQICIRTTRESECGPLAAPGRSWRLLMGPLWPRLNEPAADALWLAVLGYFSVVAALGLHASAGRRFRTTVIAAPCAVYGLLWLLAPQIGWTAGLLGLGAGSWAGWRS